jgi:hypothetical protein
MSPRLTALLQTAFIQCFRSKIYVKAGQMLGNPDEKKQANARMMKPELWISSIKMRGSARFLCTSTSTSTQIH